MTGTPTQAVQLALRKVELSDQQPQAAPALKALIDSVLNRRIPASDKPALLFILAYASLNQDHELKRVPTGWRPADKHLCSALTELGYTLHSNITAFGENMGIKGQATGYDLTTRPRTGPVLTYLIQHRDQLPNALEYVAWRFKQSYQPPVEIEALGPEQLTFVRAYRKAHAMVFAESGGHLPQFLVAALLTAFHEHWNTGLEVRTQHPHASDTSSEVAGDVEVVHPSDGLVDAYEVTVRPDWKNRRQDLLKKMKRFDLTAYHVICLTEGDPQLSDPVALETYMGDMGQDISVVDIRAFVATHLLGLTRDARARVFEVVEEMVRDPRLSGVPEYINLLKRILES